MLFLKSGKGSEKSDDEIISGFRNKQDSVFIELLFDRYSHLVFAVSMKYMKNEEDSKDIVIRIFEKLPKDLLTYTIHNFSSWLHTVTKNYCLRELSKNKRYFVPADDLPDQSEELDESFLTNYHPYLDEAINTLNKEQKICIELFYIQNLSYTEVCDKTGYTMNQVKSYIQNGKRNLKIILLKKANDK
jgi:RNA polymerase sigma-70 factor (ECF subfamily)